MNKYLKNRQYLILVDKGGAKVGKEERWKTHKKGLLHKGFSIVLFYQRKIILQKRKHPLFNKLTDFTASSHPTVTNGKPEKETEAVFRCLLREWSVEEKALKDLQNLGSFVYQASDQKGFIEHEFCTLYQGRVDFLPLPNFEFAYGFELVEPLFLIKNQNKFFLTPWVKKGLTFLNPSLQ